MAITQQNIKLLQAERMQDTDDGGGAMTGTVIIDGASNQIFDDISELDRTYGDVSLRKVFPAVYTSDTDRYYGVNLIVDSPFGDPLVDALLFSTGDWFDERSDAQNQVEAYVIRGPLSQWHLYGTQVTGQRQVLLWGRVGTVLPDVGDVLYLSQDDGEITEVGQFVRVSSVDVETQTFNDGSGAFDRDIVTVGITDPLREQFDGPEVNRVDVNLPDETAKLRETTVADAASYHGTTTLEVAGQPGDVSIEVGSVYGQLVPNARAETAVTDVLAGGSTAQTITSGGEDFEIAGPANSAAIEVTIANRAYTYVQSCNPIPAPGVTRVAYRALGKWYVLTDDGTGSLSGPGGGAGVVNFFTGSVSVTLGALPDVGSSVVFTWASGVHYTDRAGSVDVKPPRIEHDLGEPVSPGSVTFTWTENSLTRTATAAASGEISGDAEGYISHALGVFWIEFSGGLPDASTQLQVDYSTQSTVTEIKTGLVASGGHVSFTLGSLPVKPGSVVAKWETQSITNFSETVIEQVTYPGNGVYIPAQTVTEETVTNGQRYAEYDLSTVDDSTGNLGESGSINYSTGACDLEVIPGVAVNFYDELDGDWSEQSDTTHEFSSGIVTVTYIQDTGSPTVKQVFLAVPAPEIFFLPLSVDRIVPGTVRFTLNGTAFSDRAGQGVLYWNDGTVVGSVDYANRVATLNLHNGGDSVTVTSLITVYGEWHGYDFYFRTSGSPLQPGSLQVNATTLEGLLLSESCDASGVIDSTTAEGLVEQEMGVVNIRFGELVADSSLTTEEKNQPWYDPANVDGDGNIWRPEYVYPNTVKYNAVVYTYLPLDADVLGLDPVRLPSDGRVQMIRPGDVLVVHHTDTLVENTPTQSEVLDCGRTRLARVRIFDNNGTELSSPTQFTADLDAGTVTLGDMTGVAAPITVHHRIEDMALASDVRIDGVVTITRPLTHNFPADETSVCSALILGDMFARYTNLFDQETWTNEWSDTLIGNGSSASYNDTTYPVEVTNEGTIQERWALIFTGSTSFRVVGEHVGEIATGNTAADLAPNNPNTGVPYFTLRALGWGGGWAIGAVLRFNTVAANRPVWIARSIQQGPETVQQDQINLYIRGDIDA